MSIFKKWGGDLAAFEPSSSGMRQKYNAKDTSSTKVRTSQQGFRGPSGGSRASRGLGFVGASRFQGSKGLVYVRL